MERYNENANSYFVNDAEDAEKGDPTFDIWPSDVDDEDYEIRRPSRKPINPTHIKPGIEGVDYDDFDEYGDEFDMIGG